jgi:hypothetical protein
VKTGRVQTRDSATTQSRWVEGVVDPAGEHIEIRHSSAQGGSYAHWTAVALIGPPNRGTFPVRWLLDPTKESAIASEARRELEFYPVDHPRDFELTGDPWQYAIYHCGTAANVYSCIHWSYFPHGNAMNQTSHCAPNLESQTWSFPEDARDRWYSGSSSLIEQSNASGFIKRVLVQKHAVRPRRFFGEAFVASRLVHQEGYYCPFKWLTASRWSGDRELASPDAKEFSKALARHFPLLGDFQRSAAASAQLLGCPKPVGPDLWLITESGHLFIEVKLPKDSAATHQVAGLALLATQLPSEMPIRVLVVTLDNTRSLFDEYVKQITG